MALTDDVTAVLAKDLGPSAPSFLKRQVCAHMKKDPTTLTKADLDELAKWCFVGVSLILDEKTASRVKTNILSLK